MEVEHNKLGVNAIKAYVLGVYISGDPQDSE